MPESFLRSHHRRQFLQTSLLGTFFTRHIPAESPQEHPNIIILVADDLGWHDVGYHNSQLSTPNIDRLATTGVDLDRYYVYPECSPTRASLLTGMYASRLGIVSAITGRSEQVLPAETATLPRLLKDSGYQTALFGKWHLGLRPENGPNRYGFDYSYGSLHGQVDQFTHIYKNGDPTWHRNGKFIEESGHATDLIANEAAAFITNSRDKTRPFFLYIAFTVPHYPVQEEARWTDPYRDVFENESRRGVAAAITHMDQAIGRILEAVRQAGAEPNTVVLFMGDNGGQRDWAPLANEYGGRHGPYDRLGDNGPLRGWKTELWEGGIRVPAAISWPGRLRPAKTGELVFVTDMLPTLLQLSGSARTGKTGFDGIDVTAALKGEKLDTERVFYWRTRSELALRHGDWKLIHQGNDPKTGVSVLYNVAEDPYEQRNLSSERPEKVTQLETRLLAEFAKDPS